MQTFPESDRMAESDQIETNFWDGDLLNRKGAANFLEEYLTARHETKKDEEGFVLAINAEWGFGKTFMLERWKQELSSKNYPVVYFDAWKNDFTPEPLVAFISELDSCLTEFFTPLEAGEILLKDVFKSAAGVLMPTFKVLLGAGAKHILGTSVEKLVESYSEPSESESEEVADDKSVKKEIDDIKKSMEKVVENALKEHKNTKKAIIKFKEKLTLLIKFLEDDDKVNLPLFVFIDELDRCRPDYAIELLEGIKHLFGVKGIYFVIATNIAQLSESVKAVYGNGFDGTRYLKRFFDLEYTLPEPNNFDFAKHLFSQIALPENQALATCLNKLVPTMPVQDQLSYIFSKHSDYFDCSLRDQMQVMKILDAAFISLRIEKSTSPIHIHLLIFLAMLYQRSAQIFSDVVEKNNLSKMTVKIDELKINDVKGIYSVQSSAHIDGAYQYFEKKVSISQIAGLYFQVKPESDYNKLHDKYGDSREFPENLIRQLLEGTNREGLFWITEIEKHINLVRRAGGFIERK